ncbi:MAG: SPFH domain-containing protein [Planctomycetota bacterium]|jgi:regulator of protease activity HflC (stomatin/prohibitin superfamily)|nr:SPFH domain-containing protein [Planctomycetota bacterium]MDP6940499.1 SPFH domain-containing protein [Planctomycetota bacterium]
MKNARFLIALLALLVLVPTVFALCFKRIPPDVIGIKQARWGGGGIIPEDNLAGFKLGISGYHLWHYLPRETHFLHFTKSRPAGRTLTLIDSWKPSQEIRTRDNNVVSVDISIPYHIIPGQGFKVVQDGLKHEYRDRVQSTVERVIRSELSTLSSEDFQDTDSRLKRTQQILPILNVQLAEFYCKAEGILIRRFGFSNQYEDKLQEKQLLRQKANLDQALAMQANEQKVVNLIERQIVAAEKALNADWDFKLQDKQSEYQVLLADIAAKAQVYSATKRAEGEAQRDINIAEGRLALDQSEAIRNELRTSALNSEGGRILLALEAADNLSIPTVTLNSDDPSVPMLLDLGTMTRLLVGKDN